MALTTDSALEVAGDSVGERKGPLSEKTEEVGDTKEPRCDYPKLKEYPEEKPVTLTCPYDGKWS